MTDRLSAGYQPNWDIDLAVGQQGELFVTDIGGMLATGSGQIEVKTDEKAAVTQRVYVEYAQRIRTGEWVPSGIDITKALLWAYVLPGDVVLVAPTANVAALTQRFRATGRTRECNKGSHPTKGVTIPISHLAQELCRFPNTINRRDNQ